mgnify:FL=1|tara:strand:+ start:890 stop:1228 length:339 start_codon:yes stop_codon:yes gene_type:complete
MPFNTYKNDQSYIAATTMAADITGDTIDASSMNSCSFTVVNGSDNTPAGNVYIQVSNDESTWINTTATAAISGAETNLLELNNLPARFVRIFYDRTSDGADAAFDVAFTMKS